MKKSIGIAMVLLLACMGFAQTTVTAPKHPEELKEQVDWAPVASGTVMTFPNDVGGTMPMFNEIYTGAPSSSSVQIKGCIRGSTAATATCDVLETNTTNATHNSAPATTGPYDYFLVTPTLNGGTSPRLEVHYTISSKAKAGSSTGGAVLSVAGKTGVVTLAEGDIANLPTDLTAKEVLTNKTTDGTLAAASDTLYPSEKATKTYVDGHSGGSMTWPGTPGLAVCTGTPCTAWTTSLGIFGTAAGVATTSDPGTVAEVPMVANGTHGMKPSASGALGTGAFHPQYVLPAAASGVLGGVNSKDCNLVLAGDVIQKINTDGSISCAPAGGSTLASGSAKDVQIAGTAGAFDSDTGNFQYDKTAHKLSAPSLSVTGSPSADLVTTIPVPSNPTGTDRATGADSTNEVWFFLTPTGKKSITAVPFSATSGVCVDGFNGDGTFHTEACATSAVASVFGRTGTITATVDDYSDAKITPTPTAAITSAPSSGTLLTAFRARTLYVVTSGTFSITLPTVPAAGQYLDIINIGSGTVSFANGGATINGSSSITWTLPPAFSALKPNAVKIISDGTGYEIKPTIALRGSIALHTAAILSGACDTTTASVSGVTSGDAFTWTPNGSIKAITGYIPLTSGGLSIAGYPGSGTINFDVCNWSTASITPGAVTINYEDD